MPSDRPRPGGIAKALHRGMAEGAFRPVDPQIAATILFTVLHGAAPTCRPTSATSNAPPAPSTPNAGARRPPNSADPPGPRPACSSSRSASRTGRHHRHGESTEGPG
ncbi:hypothetical protein [Nonomuraea aurantiaca]|uniref:hypothetical protein n=1 Tax=Nonomuraea aurantiaca TaxID=2878562 RepID=UPI001CDA2F79|nr:hypothetical protein [Nonomuraea aurantiaca]MCA2226352.1 hypothetical protein [Nonomuraea aurantiaca]